MVVRHDYRQAIIFFNAKTACWEAGMLYDGEVVESDEECPNHVCNYRLHCHAVTGSARATFTVVE